MAFPSVEIERKFIHRKTSDDEEASLCQQVPDGRWKYLLRQRDLCDHARRFEHLCAMLPDVVANLGDGNQDTAQRLCAGLAFLIEEIHHLNETAALRRDQ